MLTDVVQSYRGLVLSVVPGKELGRATLAAPGACCLYNSLNAIFAFKSGIPIFKAVWNFHPNISDKKWRTASIFCQILLCLPGTNTTQAYARCFQVMRCRSQYHRQFCPPKLPNPSYDTPSSLRTKVCCKTKQSEHTCVRYASASRSSFSVWFPFPLGFIFTQKTLWIFMQMNF